MFEAKSLQCERNGHVLFERISFKVEAGESFYIRGKNGVGKTTLLRILAGITKADKGKVTWGEKPIHHPLTSFKNEMSYLSHQNGLKAMLRVYENLELFIILTIIANHLTTVGFEFDSKLNKYAKTLNNQLMKQFDTNE